MCLDDDVAEKAEIKKADYVSVRDRLSFSEMKKYREKTVLTPDAAVLMSDLFSRKELEKDISERVRSVQGKYVAVQLNLMYYKENEAEVIEVLEDFCCDNKGTKLVLVPIGYAIKHDDLLALKAIKTKISQAILIEKLTVKEIMYLISGAEFFVGTSLHGVVTAMSFAVPYLTVGNGFASSKLSEFLATWAIEPLNSVMNISSFNELYSKRAIYFEDLQKSSEKQKRLAKENYENIFALIK